MTIIYEFAPAKLNLYLHITGRRVDGYHDLDSLVAFASVGDQIRLEPDTAFSFVIEGPQAAALQKDSVDQNLVVQAARSLAERTKRALNIRLTLVKNLPVASGIGGGSSDAAAALRALARYWALPPNDPRLMEAASQHGQDVPVCLKIENNYITADGTLSAPDLPHVDCVLINPGKGLPTPSVYKSYREKGEPFSLQARLSDTPKDVAALIAALSARKNDLYTAACRLMPEIGDVMAALQSTKPLLARMSGSGATCFAFYADRSDARRAAHDLLTAHPDWWVVPCHLPYRAALAESFEAQETAS